MEHAARPVFAISASRSHDRIPGKKKARLGQTEERDGIVIVLTKTFGRIGVALEDETHAMARRINSRPKSVATYTPGFFGLQAQAYGAEEKRSVTNYIEVTLTALWERIDPASVQSKKKIAPR
jgi:hypothetical protein